MIPVISKADLLSPSEIASLRQAFRGEVHDAPVKPFLFGDWNDGLQLPFAVSSAKSSDDDNMDASILMSPDYVQPLVTSELEILVGKLFDHDNLAWMRHSTAKKLAQVRPDLPLLRQPRAGNNNLLGMAGALDAQMSLEGYSLARVAGYTRQEDIRLAKWASDLQRSLQNERERYSALARGERAIWLTERLNECVVDGSLVPIRSGSLSSSSSSWENKAVQKFYPPTATPAANLPAIISPQDPLGVVRWTDDLYRRGWTIVQIVSSFGIVGGLALLLANSTSAQQSPGPSSGTTSWSLLSPSSRPVWSFGYWGMMSG